MIVGSRIKDARCKMSLSQEELGELVGVSKVSICGYEQETRVPSLPVFEELVKVLNVTPNYLLGMDVEVVSEDTNMSVKLRKEDLKILSEIKKNKELYDALIEDSSRTIKLINKKLYD